MSTSGITTFSMTRDGLIYAAARKLSAISDGQTLSPTQLTNGGEALNAMLKTFQTTGMPLWALKNATFTLADTTSYNIGVGQTLNTPAPLKVHQAMIKDESCDTLYPLNIVTRYDYNLLPTNTSGAPVSIWYEPLNQSGVIHLWPRPDSYSIENRRLAIVYQRPFEDMVAGTDTLDFPQHWHETVIYGLAARLAPEFGVPLIERRDWDKKADGFLEMALSFGTEEGSLLVQPDWR